MSSKTVETHLSARSSSAALRSAAPSFMELVISSPAALAPVAMRKPCSTRMSSNLSLSLPSAESASSTAEGSSIRIQPCAPTTSWRCGLNRYTLPFPACVPNSVCSSSGKASDSPSSRTSVRLESLPLTVTSVSRAFELSGSCSVPSRWCALQLGMDTSGVGPMDVLLMVGASDDMLDWICVGRSPSHILVHDSGWPRPGGRVPR